jgi:hypothetical protein
MTGNNGAKVVTGTGTVSPSSFITSTLSGRSRSTATDLS